jgi:hypothetical protein
MSPGIRGSIAVAIAALCVRGLFEAASVLVFCREHQAWVTAHGGHPTPVLQREYRVARQGDGVFACDRPHMAGPIVLHIDLRCYCAPATVSPSVISMYIGGPCTLDQAKPGDERTVLQCRERRCEEYLDLTNHPE